jgi:hypothetical protein
MAMLAGLHLVDKAFKPAPEPESVPTFRKIDENRVIILREIKKERELKWQYKNTSKNL